MDPAGVGVACRSARTAECAARPARGWGLGTGLASGRCGSCRCRGRFDRGFSPATGEQTCFGAWRAGPCWVCPDRQGHFVRLGASSFLPELQVARLDEGQRCMASPSTSSTPAAQHGRPVVIAVDDEVMILELIAMVLAPHGYQVETFDDPARALEAIKADPRRVSLVITDYAMHTMNGMEFIEQCRLVFPDLKIILASGTVNEQIYAQSPVKPDGFLAKPFQTSQLIAAVRQLLGR